jgi:hypothetical protein
MVAATEKVIDLKVVILVVTHAKIVHKGPEINTVKKNKNTDVLMIKSMHSHSNLVKIKFYLMGKVTGIHLLVLEISVTHVL